jgi:hypothetical protein
MPDKIAVTVLRQKVFHDGKSVVVLKPGDGEVEERFIPGLVADRIILDPNADTGEAGAAQDGNADDVEALRARIAELEAERDDLLAELNAGGLLDEHGNPVTPPPGDVNDPPSELDLTDEQRAKLPQLDHDGDGHPDGSIAQTGDDLAALREEYKALTGKQVFNGWDADTVRAKIAELKAGAAQTGDAADEDDAPPA